MFPLWPTDYCYHHLIAATQPHAPTWPAQRQPLSTRIILPLPARLHGIPGEAGRDG
ncbi:hypothetical protein BO78DRAFT_193022 [Aspergillus sclerotiicarbonarius CBS 121057]|uniref:Uncharacterized protein n=1 Tax=Aspergillus sclerotiicarbonarius (strain CBS 121057 / IBT 28362) TaxID=1448318 RepID=A0A319ERW9_ASPSB|nr:hypothetical protein BO78DRAFT_193022 [Aspergillus sclerotiicarbonarius CBS 121057]